MKSRLLVGFVVVFSGFAMAQQRANMPPGVGGAPPLLGPSYPGVGGALPIVNPFSGSVSFAQRLGATTSWFSSYTGAPAGSRRQGARRGYAGYPLLYPTFGPLGYAYDQPADATPPPPDQPESANPPVVINQNFAPQAQEPAIQSYAAPSPERPEPPEDQPLFFIALTDSSVYTAVAYWVEGGTLNYITPQGRHNQVSLPLIDRETTTRLNRGSKFQLHLPG
jgi:hypothetical protein